MKEYGLYVLSYFLVAFFLMNYFISWIFLIKKTKQIEKKRNRLIYAFGYATFLLIFPWLLSRDFVSPLIFGLLLGLFLILTCFLYWGKPLLVTHQSDKTFKRRFIISFLLMLALLTSLLLYIATNATCCSITVASPDGGYDDTFAKDTNK